MTDEEIGRRLLNIDAIAYSQWSYLTRTLGCIVVDDERDFYEIQDTV